MGIHGTCEKCGGDTHDYLCINCLCLEKQALEKEVRTLRNCIIGALQSLNVAMRDYGQPTGEPSDKETT